MKKLFARIIAMILIIALCAPFTAYAAEYDLSNGSVTVTGGAEAGSQTVTQGGKSEVDAAPVIKQSGDVTSNTITIDGTAGDANVTIRDVNIDTGSETPAISVTGDATIIVDGENTVQSEGTGIQATTGNLTISGADAETEGTENTLRADGDDTGIAAGNLTVGQNVTVTGQGGSTGVVADVTVNGGNLNAYGDVNCTGANGVGIDGNLTVNSGAAAVYGDDVGVKGAVTVAEGDTAGAEIHSRVTPVSGTNTGAVTIQDSYVPEAHGVMYYSMRNYYGFDIQGYHNGGLCGTTYGNDGYVTCLRIGDKVADLSVFPGAAAVVDGLSVQIKLVPRNNGQLVQIVYTVTNISGADMTFDLATGADVEIRENDYAAIENLKGDTGFQMTDNRSDTTFAFFGKGYEGVTDVDGFWHGEYWDEWSGDYKQTSIFKTTPTVYDETGYDSAASWCWLAEEIAAGQTVTYSVLLGVGDADELKDAAGDNVLVPEPTPEPEPEPEMVVPRPALPSSVLDIKLDAVEEVIDLANGTQDGNAMEKIEAEVEILSGAVQNSGIIVYEVTTSSENTVENLPKENVAMAFAVAYIQDGVVKNLPGQVELKMDTPEVDLDGYKLVFVGENGQMTEIDFELVDGKIVFIAKAIGLYMMIKK